MDLSRLPRRVYTPGPTAVEPLDRLSEALGCGVQFFIKRDDQLGLTAGGNKTRKLEFLVAEALAQGADTLITCGGVQSNHCRLTLAAAVQEGLACRLVLAETPTMPYTPDGGGNVLLYHLLGAERIQTVPWGTDLIAAMNTAAHQAQQEGRKPYLIPLGGSSGLGSLGYARCAVEILDQAVTFQHIGVAVGSTGTLAGLLVGLRSEGSSIPVTGVSVLYRRDKAEALALETAQAASAVLKRPCPVQASDMVCLDDYLGEGYTLPTPGMVEAVRLMARTEGILLDPTYTGKALAGLIDLARKGHFRQGDRVLFVHTGGAPGLYARPHLF